MNPQPFSSLLSMGVTASRSLCVGVETRPPRRSHGRDPPSLSHGGGRCSIPRAAGTMAHHLFKVVENFLLPLRMPDSTSFCFPFSLSQHPLYPCPRFPALNTARRPSGSWAGLGDLWLRQSYLGGLGGVIQPLGASVASPANGDTW